MAQDSGITSDKPFRVGEWRIDPAAGRIRRGETEVKLEPKVMRVLICLARRAGTVVTREELEAQAWAGTVVGYDALASAIIKLRKAFGDNPKRPAIIETVPKKGYRLIAEAGPVPETIPSVAAVSADVGTSPRLRLRNPLIAATLASVVLAGAYVWLVPPQAPTAPAAPAQLRTDKPSIAVLPFGNMSNDPEQEYFSDGITADLITDLSKVSGLSVIARNSVFTYKNAPVDIRRVGDDLGVRYVIEGTVRKAGETVRITASLIDAHTNHQLWANRFDGSLDDVFAFQDEVTARIVSSLRIRLTDNERLRLAEKYTNSIKAYDQFLHGWQRFWEFSKQGNDAAKEHYYRALDLDRDFARAHANLALAYAYEYINGWSATPETSLEQAHLFAEKAIALNAKIPQVHWAMGLTQMFDKEYEQALRSVEQSITADPNYADGYGLLGTILNYAGRPKEALGMMERAMRLNPRHPYIYKVIYGEMFFNLRDYDDAIHQFTLALDRNPDAQEPRLWRAAAYAYVGRSDDAEWDLEQVRAAHPELSLAHLEEVVPFNDPLQRKHLIDGLFKAGLER